MPDSAEETGAAAEEQLPEALEHPPHEGFTSGQLLRGPDLLTALEASSDLARGPGNVVVWAGERGSGKTTLTGELYEHHRTGRAATRFVGTRTLLGFEERIHPARADSGRITPHSARTESDPEGRELLHLAVGLPETQLLFADLPGETFRRLRNNDLPPDDVPLLARADKLGILIDGERIADPGKRATAVSFARQLIDRLGDGGIPTAQTEAMIVLTKLDKVVEAGTQALEYWATKEEQLLLRLRERSSSCRAMRTSARGSEVDDDGMDALMRWLMEPVAPAIDPPLEEMPPPRTRMQRLARPKALT